MIAAVMGLLLLGEPSAHASGQVRGDARGRKSTSDWPFKIRAAKSPITVDVQWSQTDGAWTVSPEARASVIFQIDANPSRLVVLRPSGVALCFDRLGTTTKAALVERRGQAVADEYDRFVAGLVGEFLDDVRQSRPRAALSVEGLPLEGASERAAHANRVFRDVVDSLAALVPGVDLVSGGPSQEAQLLRRSFPRAVEVADGRAILYEHNGKWRIALPESRERSNAVVRLEAAESPGGTAPLGRPGDDSLPSLELVGSPEGSVVDGDAGPGTGTSSSDGVAPGLASGGGVSAGGGGGGGGGVGGGSSLPDSSGPDDGGGTGDGAAGEEAWDPAGEIDWWGDGDAGDWSGSGSAGDVPLGGGGGGDGSPDGPGGVNENGGDDGVGGSDSSGEAADDAVGQSLECGGGFSEPTPMPPGVGDMADPFGDKSPIARWSTIAFQIVESPFEVGVVAFHGNGIDRVEFIADGGPPTVVRSMSVNPRTGSREYWCTLDPSTATDGPIEIRAVIHPAGSGLPMVLQGELAGDAVDTGRHSLLLYGNAGQSLDERVYYVNPLNGSDAVGVPGTRQAPFRTIARAALQIGSSEQARKTEIVLLSAGEYELWDYPSSWGWRPDGVNASNEVRTPNWIVVRPDSTLAAEDVVLVSRGNGPNPNEPDRRGVGDNIRLVKFERCTIDLATITSFYRGFGKWFHKCKAVDSSGILQHFGDPGGQMWWVRVPYACATDSVVSRTLLGFCAFDVVRKSLCDEVYADQFAMSGLVHESETRLAAGTELAYHADTHQYWGPHENIISFGVRHYEPASIQGFFLDHIPGTYFDGMAMVDIAFDHPRNAVGFETTQFHAECTNVIFAHVSLPWQKVFFNLDHLVSPFLADDVLFHSCIFGRVLNGSYYTVGLPAQVRAEHCHFTDPGFLGEIPTVTTGPVLLDCVDQQGWAYTGIGTVDVMSGAPVFGNVSADVFAAKGALLP